MTVEKIRRALELCREADVPPCDAPECRNSHCAAVREALALLPEGSVIVPRSEIDGLRDRIDELEQSAGEVSAEFERDLSVVMRQLLDECNFDFDGDPWTADTAYQHIHDTLADFERRIAAAEEKG